MKGGRWAPPFCLECGTTARDLSDVPFLLRVRRALKRVAVAANAPAMQAYMKSDMPYHGVSAVALRAACRKVFAARPITSAEAWRRDALALWDGATHREERYAAIEWTGDRRARPFQTLEALPMYEHMIVTGAWWDTVDALAKLRLGELLRREPRRMRSRMLAWSRDSNIWKKRAAILCQLGFKKDTDLPLLYACIEPSLEPNLRRVALRGRELSATELFFLRKAIGWALRQYAWTDPKEIARYVGSRWDALSGLSRREALKNV
jgi:3-methyladenine DNA glycosylase AlkD